MPIYTAIYDGPPKGYSKTSSKKRYIAIHNTANDASAENEASYAKRRTDSVSSHYYVDNDSIVQSLDTNYCAWHAGSYTGNTYAISYEITGTNSKSRDWWLKNVAWEKLAEQIAADMKHFGIANKFLSVKEMQDGKSTGIVTHNNMRLAWGGTDHTDPGSNFPMDYLVEMVNKLIGEEMYTEAEMRSLPWQYAGRGMPGVPEGKSTLWVLGTIYSTLQEVKTAIAGLNAKPTIPADTPVVVNISDEQLERVFRKIIGSVDE